MNTYLSQELKKFFASARGARLSSADRASIRAALTEYAAAHPVRVDASRRLQHQTDVPTPSPYYSWLIPKPMPALAFLIATALLGGGTSYAAEGSLPGDLLYPVKVGVNESVQEALALTPGAKANVEAAIATKRLDEAQHLAALGRISSTTAAALVANFTNHADAAAKSASELAKTDPAAAAEIDSSLTARIAANQGILAALAGTATDTPEVDGIVASLTAHLAKTEREGRVASSTAVANLSDQAFASLQDRAQRRIDGAKGALAAFQTNAVSATSTAASFAQNAEDAIARAEQALATASSSLANGDKSAAYAAYTASLNASAEAQAFIGAAMRVNAVAGREDSGEREASQKRGEGETHASATSSVMRAEHAPEIRENEASTSPEPSEPSEQEGRHGDEIRGAASSIGTDGMGESEGD